MATLPSAVVFDLGKVLVDFDYSIVVRRVAARSRASLDQLQRLLLKSPLLPAYERGEMSSQEFFLAIRSETGFEGEYHEFALMFADIFTEIPAMIALQAALRAASVPTFIFSNTNDLAIAHIRQRFPFFGGFNGYVLSYEHGSMKPDAPLYERVEGLTGLKGADLLYLDDRPENVAAGLDRGWRAILHQDPRDSWDRVRATGLLPDAVPPFA